MFHAQRFSWRFHALLSATCTHLVICRRVWDFSPLEPAGRGRRDQSEGGEMPQPRTHAADLCCVNSGSQRLIKAYDRGTSGYLGRHTPPLSIEKLRELGVPRTVGPKKSPLRENLLQSHQQQRIPKKIRCKKGLLFRPAVDLENSRIGVGFLPGSLVLAAISRKSPQSRCISSS